MVAYRGGELLNLWSGGIVKARPKRSKAGSENKVQASVKKALDALPGVSVMRNNVGSYRSGSGHWVKYGLGLGSPDLVGWKTLEITPELVGTRVAVFVGIEVKRPASTAGPRVAAGVVTPRQRAWMSRLEAAGGIGAVVCSVLEALSALGLSDVGKVGK